MNSEIQSEGMLRVEEVIKLSDLELLRNELKKREELYNKLVGNLYKSVVFDEILNIRERIWQVREERNKRSDQ